MKDGEMERWKEPGSLSSSIHSGLPAPGLVLHETNKPSSSWARHFSSSHPQSYLVHHQFSVLVLASERQRLLFRKVSDVVKRQPESMIGVLNPSLKRCTNRLSVWG